MMQLRKLKEDANTITLGWDPVPGAEGWLFYKDGVRVSKSFDVSKRTVKFSKPGVYRVQAVGFAVIDQDTYPDAPPDPTPKKRYAPRTHNLGGRDQDPRFCTRAEYGVMRQPDGNYIDEMGCIYNSDGFNVGGVWRDRNYIVPGLKGADSMDGMEPCDPYSANGISVPPYPGDPAAQTGSFHR